MRKNILQPKVILTYFLEVTANANAGGDLNPPLGKNCTMVNGTPDSSNVGSCFLACPLDKSDIAVFSEGCCCFKLEHDDTT